MWLCTFIEIIKEYQYKDHLGNVRLSYTENLDIDIPETVFYDNATNTQGWDSNGPSDGGSAEVATDKSYSGGKSFKIHRTTGTSHYAHSNERVAIDNDQETAYTFSGRIFVESEGYAWGKIILFMDDETGSEISTETASGDKIKTKGEWVYFEKTVMVPANIDKINLRIGLYHQTNNATAWFDDLKIVKGNLSRTTIVEESNYYPFGLKHKGYNNVVNGVHHPYGYNGKEENDELGLNWLDFGMRNYDAALGRWMNIDPMAEVMHNQSPYNFALNSPLLYVDPDGALPWPIHVRSFISTNTVGARNEFRGDGRGPSTKSSPASTSRVESTFTVDPAKGTVTSSTSRSDDTVFYPMRAIAGQEGNQLPIAVSETPKPTSSISNVKTSENSVGLDFEHSAKDPITPSLVTPDLDVQANLNITEDLDAGVLNITGEFTGDAFPSTEAFITDQSGETRLLLGAHKEQGGLLNLFGENKRPTFSVNMQVNIDKNGNFTGVTQGDKTYTVQEWNKHVQDSFK